MSDNIIQMKLPDEILIDATRMFLPDVVGLNMRAMCEQAICELRKYDERVKYHGVSLEKAKFQASDPVCIANYVMMFVAPALAGDKKYHEWHGRLILLRSEREKRFFGDHE